MTQLDHAIIAVKITRVRRQIEEIEQLLSAALEHSGTSQAPAATVTMADRIRALLSRAPKGLTSAELINIVQPLGDRPKDAIWQCLSRLKKAGELKLVESHWIMVPRV